jgi:hypothetical protein
MNTIAVGSLSFARVSGRCPHCHVANIHWFGILRICATCRHTFHWRDAMPESISE